MGGGIGIQGDDICGHGLAEQSNEMTDRGNGDVVTWVNIVSYEGPKAQRMW